MTTHLNLYDVGLDKNPANYAALTPTQPRRMERAGVVEADGDLL
jgi:hypothetical protein